MIQTRSVHGIVALCVSVGLLASHAAAEEVPFRPEAGKFPPVDKAHSYRGELVFVDHANRRGSLRVQGAGKYFRNAPNPFAMLPYGIIRYHGAPADLRDIPLGTVLHVRAFLPPDPKLSTVPVLPVNNRNKTSGYSGQGIAPAENHVLLLEDEPSYCQRVGLFWKLHELEIKDHQGMITAGLESKSGSEGESQEEAMTFDAATRIWRGRERLGVEDLVEEGIWPDTGKHALDDQPVLLGITWKPTPSGVFTRFHISDIWLDDTAMQRAAGNQTETHRAFIRSRWLPAWVDDVKYGKFGSATVTATLFGGMDPALYAEFRKGSSGLMNAVESTLKHGHGAYGPAHMACKGPILDVIKTSGEVPLGSSGIQIRFQTDLIIEGIRPGRIVRVCPGHWPQVNLPREEYLNGVGLDERFPSPAIFPKY
ncbi:MAG TPA: hypothetical protein DCY79_05800 [Planctomycetaceae bacterium]|nr:hypothetical protein [Blastopirellula sp.]HAY79304.1 hypothetical protein [Planctomycetaceae bacterium]